MLESINRLYIDSRMLIDVEYAKDICYEKNSCSIAAIDRNTGSLWQFENLFYFVYPYAWKAARNSLKKIQYYADRDIVLKREMETGVTKVSSGKLKLENGHYVNIITLKKNTRAFSGL